MDIEDAIVIGAGLAGLTVAAALQEKGLRLRLLEKRATVGESWQGRHPGLTLNTHRDLSALPGSSYPKGTGAYPKRDAVIAHLRAFAETRVLRVEHDVAVTEIRREDDHFLLETSKGALRTRNVIVATGRDAVPDMPRWDGVDLFRGRIVHAADLGSTRAYVGKSVLVVGAGNSGFDVLNHLSRVETEKIWLSARGGLSILPRRLMGFSVHRLSPLMDRMPTRLVDRFIAMTERLAFGNVRRLGFRKPEAGAATRLARDKIAIPVDDGAIAAMRSGRIDVVSAVRSFSSTGVHLADGTVVTPDVVIAATGYATGLQNVVGDLVTLDRHGCPVLDGPKSEVGGLWFAGMRPGLVSYFANVKAEADIIASHISKTCNV